MTKVIGNFSVPNMPGCILVGPRGSGKSRAAADIADEALRQGLAVLEQETRKWPRGSAADPAAQTRQVDAEIVAALGSLRNAPTEAWWILDDAEVLLAHASDHCIRTVAQACRDGAFGLVLVRNYLVQEDTGWLAEREGPLRAVLPQKRIPPLEREAALSLALGRFGSAPDAMAKASWLVAWAGGNPGMQFELAPYVPTWPAESTVSPKLNAFMEQTRHDLALDREPRRTLIAAIVLRALPPPLLLSPDLRLEVGFLVARGIVFPNYGTAASPFTSRFWEVLAEGAGLPQVANRNSDIDLALALELAVSEAGLQQELCDSLNLSSEATTLASALERALRWQRLCLDDAATGRLPLGHRGMPPLESPMAMAPVTIAEILANHLGRAGLRRMLHQHGLEAGADDAVAMAIRLILSLRGAGK